MKNPIISDDKGKDTVNDTLDSSCFLSKSQGDTITELEGFVQKNANTIVTYKEDRNGNPYVSAQEEQLKMQRERERERERDLFSRKEIDCKQRTIDKLLQTLAVCLQRQSLIHDENIFHLQNFKINSNIQN